MNKIARHPLIDQSHYTDLLYKVEEIDRTTYWAGIHKKKKVSTEDYSSHVT
jgi:hypothetical protein